MNCPAITASGTAAAAAAPLGRNRRLRDIRTLVESTVNRTIPVTDSPNRPIESLRRGDWVKLICGASFEDVADIRNLSLVYTLAGVDCIDCAADVSVVNAVNDGIYSAQLIASVSRPWVMISVNDDREDVHFRKAEFNSADCPSNCSRPCQKVCPASAISFPNACEEDGSSNGKSGAGKLQGGVTTERCYGCGRCFPVCPYDKIRAVTYQRDPAYTRELLKRTDVDAIEIHTRGRHADFFEQLWYSLGNSVHHLKLAAVSLPDLGESTVASMNMIYSIMKSALQCYNLWQLDGRPMSGDIGKGATRDTIAFAEHLIGKSNRPQGFYQLAGGTNFHTIDLLNKRGLFQQMKIYGSSQESQGGTREAIFDNSEQALINGIAYGGYARKIVGRVLRKMPNHHGAACIEDFPDYLLEALHEAFCLIGPVKSYNLHQDSVW